MFGRKKEAPPVESGPSKAELKKEIQSLKDELADLKHEKKIAEEDIKHMVRIEKERMEVENEKKQLARDREQQQEIAKVKDEYRDKLEQRLQTEVDNIKEMYAQILERLPNVTAKFSGSV